MPENVLQFTTRVDLSGAKAGLADLASEIDDQMQAAADAVEAASAAISDSLDSQASAAQVSSEQINAAYQKIEAQGLETLEALNAATQESAGVAADAAAATSDAVESQAAAVVASVDIQAAAYRQLAAATIQSASAKTVVSGITKALYANEIGQAEAEELLAAALEESAGATEQLALAKKNLAEVTAYTNAETKVSVEAQQADVAAKEENVIATDAAAAAEEGEGAALRSTLSARMAASAEIRELEGNIQGSTRAAGAFLTMLPGVGAAMQTAFTVFGAVALLEVIYEIGKALSDAFDLTGKRAEELQSQNDAVEQSFKRTNTEIEIQTQKLEEETAKLEHKPFSGLQLALLEAQDAADKLVDKLKNIETEEQKSLKGLEGSGLQRFLGITVDTHDEQVMLAQHQHWLDQAKDTQGVINEEQNYGIALQQRMVELRRQEADAGNSVEAGLYQKDIDNTQKLIDKQQEELAVAKNMQEQNAATVTHQHAVDAHSGENAADKAAREKLKAIETEFADLNRAKQKISDEELSPAAAEKFWNAYIATFKEKTDEYRTVEDNVIKYAHEAHKQLFDELLKSSPEQAVHFARNPEENQQAIDAASRKYEEMARAEAEATKGQEEFQKATQKAAENLYHTGDAWDKVKVSAAEGQEIVVENKAALEAAGDAAKEAEGKLRPLAAAQLAAARDASTYAARLAILNLELSNLQKQSTIKLDAVGNQVNTDPANAEAIQKLQNEIAQLTGQAQVQAVQSSTKEAQAIAAPYLTAFNAINSGWLKVQNDLIAGNKNIEKDFVQMGVKLVQDAASSTEQWLAKKLAAYILDLAAQRVHVTTTAANQTAETASVTAGTVAQTVAVTTAQTTQTAVTATAQAAQKIAAVASIQTDAAKAAASTYSTIAAIPVVGPFLAPAAAAVAYGAVAAFEAFEAGGIVNGSAGSPVPIVAHAGERVLSVPQTQTFERLANQPPAGASGNFHLHYQPSVSAYDRSGMRSTLRAHADDVVDIVRSAYKDGRLK